MNFWVEAKYLYEMAAVMALSQEILMLLNSNLLRFIKQFSKNILTVFNKNTHLNRKLSLMRFANCENVKHILFHTKIPEIGAE